MVLTDNKSNFQRFLFLPQSRGFPEESCVFGTIYQKDVVEFNASFLGRNVTFAKLSQDVTLFLSECDFKKNNEEKKHKAPKRKAQLLVRLSCDLNEAR